MELAEEDKRIVLVCADSALVIKAEEFKKKYPDRFFDVGIAEQNAVDVAAGLASCGLIPFFATYSGFITMRACEQIRTFVAYPNLNVKFVGANGGMASGEREGVTHQFFEDVGIVRTISGIDIVVPADASQVKEAVRAVAKVEGPCFIRIGSGRDPVVTDDGGAPFEFGKVRILRDAGNDVAIFVMGFVTNRALEAADLLKQEGINAVVVDVHTLRPLDVGSITSILQKTRAAVTVEDHNIIGGLGSAIAEVSAEEMPAHLTRIGLRGVYPESGFPDALLDKYHIGVVDIVSAAKKVVAKKLVNTLSVTEYNGKE
ncbi:MAG: transketolase [Anaerolineales bacterium]|nr:MAG: transketolase [Anaerolineales bacterium]